MRSRRQLRALRPANRRSLFASSAPARTADPHGQCRRRRGVTRQLSARRRRVWTHHRNRSMGGTRDDATGRPRTCRRVQPLGQVDRQIPACSHFIASALEDTRARASNIVCEITETALVRDIASAEAFVRGLNDIGIKVALDDFGAGYGGFAYLKRLPVVVPQDRSRVRE